MKHKGLKLAVIALAAGLAMSVTEVKVAVPAFAMTGILLENYVPITRQLRQDVLTIDNNPHEPGALLFALGRDPVQIAQAIDSRIAWQPELGVVRGPAGILSSGRGGDWDRAVLLQAVLEAAGYATRLAIVERDDGERDEVVRQFLAGEGRLAAPMPAGGRLAEPDLGDTALLERYGVPIQNHVVLTADATARWLRLLDEAHDSGERLAHGIVEGSSSPHVGPPVSFDYAAWEKTLMDAAREAVAVEIQLDDEWLLLKPGPDGDEIDWSRARRTPGAPAECTATLTLGIEMRVSKEGSKAENITLLEHSEDLGGLFRRPIRLEIAPDAGGGPPAGPGAWTAEQWDQKVDGFERFQAVLWVGREMFSSLVFDMSGQLYQVDRDGRIEGAKMIGGSVQKGFGLFTGAPRTPSPEQEDRLESIVLTIDVDRPGLPKVRGQRMLYGPLRPGATPVFQADILAAGGPVSPASVVWMALDTAITNAPVMERVTAVGDPGGYPDQATARMPEMLHEWLLARSDLADRQLSANPGLTALCGPAVSMHTSQLVRDNGSGRVMGRTALDVVWDGFRLGPRTMDNSSAALKANIALGAAATTFEALLLRERVSPATIVTASAAVELLHSHAASGSHKGVKPSPLASWGMERNEAGRSLVFAGPDPVNFWWSIDPKTGAAIGRGGGGEGQAAAEYGNIQKQNLNNLKCFLEALGGATGGQYVACVAGVGDAKGRVGAGVALRKELGGFDSQAKLFGALSQAATILGGIEKAKKMSAGE